METNRSPMRLVAATAMALGLLVALISLLSADPLLAVAASPARDRPSPASLTAGSVITVCLSGCAHDNVQAAVDAATAGDEIRIATGTYTGVQARSGVTQVVYLDKPLTLRGGYTTTDWTQSDPVNYPTTLDARGAGRVLYLAPSVSATIDGLRITGGHAAGLGGGPSIAVDDAGGGVFGRGVTLHLTNSEVVANAADFGAGVYLHDAQGNIAGSLVANNDAAQRGGGIYLWRSDVALTENTVADNTAHSGGGLYVYQSDALLVGNAVTGNSADNGAGFYFFGGASTLEGNAVTGNTAGYGGGLYLYSNVALLSDNVVADNQAGTSGGGLYVLLGAPRLVNNLVTADQALWGGGIYLIQSEALLRGNTVTANAATWKGGGVRLVRGAVTLEANTITHNTAARGAGVQAEESQGLMVDNLISHNEASDGGGLHLLNTADRVTANTILSNTASGIGGGLWIDASASLVADNRIAANHARYGGGFYLLGDGAATVRGNAVVSNTADYRGGGAYVDQSDSVVEGNDFRGNATGQSGGGAWGGRYGGGLYIYGGAPALHRNHIVANQATHGGGGLYLQDSHALLVNTLVAHNSAETSGSGLTVLTGQPRALHTTLVANNRLVNDGGNDGDGSGIFVAAGTIELTNTILVSHTVGVHAAEGATARLEATLWWGNERDANGPGAVLTGTPSSNVGADPLFVAPHQDDYRLTWGSPAIDAGVEAGVVEDLDRRPRPVPHDGRPDLGAYEHMGVFLGPSSKRVTPDRAGVGDVVTYTVVLRNEGTMPAEETVLYDPLPAQLTYIGGWASSGVYSDAGGIHWTGVVTPDHPVTITYRVTVENDAVIDNVATITDTWGTVTRVRARLNALKLYFPLVVR